MDSPFFSYLTLHQIAKILKVVVNSNYQIFKRFFMENPMKNASIVGVDLSKNYMHVVFTTGNGTVIQRKRYYKASLAELAKDLPPKVTVCAEACAGAHFFGRFLESLGFTVKLIPPQYVKPYVQRNKNDFNDAEAIAEAAGRKKTKFVPIKTEYLQGVQSLHTIRSQIVSVRTQFFNCMRGVLSEFGVKVSQGVSSIRRYLSEEYDNDERVNCYTRLAIDALLRVMKEIDAAYDKVDSEIRKVARTNKKAKQLITIPGIGVLTATALLTVSGDPHIFKNGRAFSACIGLVPKQDTTGEKPKLLGISKQGNRYVRHLLTICARTLMIKANRTVVSKHTQRNEYKSNDKMSLWIRKLLARNVHTNKVCIAIANKLARISYRILVDDKVQYNTNLSNDRVLMQ